MLKGQVAWISEKQRLPVKKTSGKASFYGYRKNIDGRGWFAAARPSIVKNKSGGPLHEIEAAGPLTFQGKSQQMIMEA